LNDELYTVAQIAALAKCSVRTIKREIKAGKLAAVMRERKLVVSSKAWSDYLLDRRIESLTPPERRRVENYAWLPKNPEQEAKLTAEAIRANRAPFPFSGPAVYFLWRGDELVYIGQAVNLFARVATHLRDKEFDGFSYVPCALQELNELERRAILMWQPTLNKRFVYVRE
jgi:hypothetical protein